MADEVQRVAIAVVEHAGRYLVGTRGPAGTLAGRAEFPGGKCLPHEEGSAAAVRECREETGLEVIPLHRLYACRHRYDYGTLDLEFWLCRLATPEISAAAGGGFEWLPVQALKSLHFPEANRPVIVLLTAGPESAG
jgi:mutator protein MutT